MLSVACWTAGFLLIGYAALLAMIWFNQNRFIYPIPPTRHDVPAGFERIKVRTADNLELTAGFRAPQRNMPVLLLFHGNGSSWQSSALVMERLAQSGYGVLAAEYRGYSENPGVPSEVGLYQDARGAFDWLRARGYDEHSIVLIGNSIGCSVATQLATVVHPRALVLISPFDSLISTASRKLPWLPMKVLLRDAYDNVGKLGHVAAPVLIMHGEEDTVIGVDQARTLAAAREHALLETYSGWGHDLIAHTAAQDRLASFLDELRMP